MNAQLPFPDLRTIWNDGHPRSLQADLRFQDQDLHLIGAVVCDKAAPDAQNPPFEVRADHRIHMLSPAGQTEVVLSEEDLLRMLSRVIAARQHDEWHARLQALVTARPIA